MVTPPAKALEASARFVGTTCPFMLFVGPCPVIAPFNAGGVAAVEYSPYKIGYS